MAVDRLAKMTGCDIELLARMLRHLVSVGYLEIVDSKTFKTTKFSALLVEKGYRDNIPFLTELALPAIRQIPKFLEKTKYHDLTDRGDSPFIECNNGRAPFDVLAQSPELATNFNEVMKVTNEQYAKSMSKSIFSI